MGPGRLRAEGEALRRGRIALASLLATTVAGSSSIAAPELPATPERVAAMRAAMDVAAQRAHLWRRLEALSAPAGGRPAFEGWAGESALFGKPANGTGRGMAGFGRGEPGSSDASGAPVIAYSLYNPAAFQHIRARALDRVSGLDALRGRGAPSVPEFPVEAAIVKTVWWPVARNGVTALPVWDPGLNPPAQEGNPYLGWRRLVAVDPTGGGGTIAETQFVGRTERNVARVGLDAFHALTVTADLARRMHGDAEANRTAILVLGRPLAAGDYLVLVGLNLMTREQADWVWGAFWWHDRPDSGPFAAGRPTRLAGPWRHFLMQAAFDTETPRAADGGAHVCFNPWLEGRFPDAGRGGGVASNCMACHARASYPAASFLPVTRGRPDAARDPALAPDRLRTSFLWSLPLHARR